ncbi:MAG: hypothetical protein Q8M94_04305 [Ignavibacteria bacterium]|nr:hypothetical protein [Ignavibacteria bacterium]
MEKQAIEKIILKKIMNKSQNLKPSIWKWEEVEYLAKDLFSIWQYGEDLEWLKKNWNKFHWVYKNETEKIELKIKLLTLTNIYYEFCHQAYDMTYEILSEDIVSVEFPFYHIQNLIKKHNVTLETRSSLVSKVFELIQKFKYSIFEELVLAFGGIEEVYNEFERIIPTTKADYAGWEYIMHWGDTYSNFE